MKLSVLFSTLVGLGCLAPAAAHACSCYYTAATPCEAVARAAAIADTINTEKTFTGRYVDSNYFAAIVQVGEVIAIDNYQDFTYAVTVEEQLAGLPVTSSFPLASRNSAMCGTYFRFEPGQRVLVLGSLRRSYSDSSDLSVSPTYCSDYHSVYPIEKDRVVYQEEYNDDARKQTFTLNELRGIVCQTGNGRTQSTNKVAAGLGDYTLAPTLASDQVVIGTVKGVAASQPNITVVDMTGRVIMRPALGPVDVSGLRAGMYHVLIRDEEGIFRGTFVRGQ